MRSRGNGRQEAVGAADVRVCSGFAAAPTASLQKMAGGSKVGVADSTSRTGSAATPTLQKAEAMAMRGVVVGVPEYVLAASFARTSTRPTALRERDWCFVDVLLPPKFGKAKHSSPTETEESDGKGATRVMGEMGLAGWTRVRSLRAPHSPTHTSFAPRVTRITTLTPPSSLVLSPSPFATFTTPPRCTN